MSNLVEIDTKLNEILTYLNPYLFLRHPVYLRYTWDMSSNMPEIYLIYTQDLPDIHLIYLWYTQDIPEIYLWYTLDIPEMFLVHI